MLKVAFFVLSHPSLTFNYFLRIKQTKAALDNRIATTGGNGTDMLAIRLINTPLPHSLPPPGTQGRRPYFDYCNQNKPRNNFSVMCMRSYFMSSLIYLSFCLFVCLFFLTVIYVCLCNVSLVATHEFPNYLRCWTSDHFWGWWGVKYRCNTLFSSLNI